MKYYLRKLSFFLIKNGIIEKRKIKDNEKIFFKSENSVKIFFREILLKSNKTSKIIYYLIKIRYD
jgi:hypothetical protein